MELIDVSGSLTTLVTQFTAEIGQAAPTIVGAVLLVSGVGIGFRWIKKLAGQIG